MAYEIEDGIVTEECLDCDGEGKVIVCASVPSADVLGSRADYIDTCERCQGTGRIQCYCDYCGDDATHVDNDGPLCGKHATLLNSEAPE